MSRAQNEVFEIIFLCIYLQLIGLMGKKHIKILIFSFHLRAGKNCSNLRNSPRMKTHFFLRFGWARAIAGFPCYYPRILSIDVSHIHPPLWMA